MYPHELKMYRKDMDKFREQIWTLLERNDMDFDGFQSSYEFFFFSTEGIPRAPSMEYYLE